MKIFNITNRPAVLILIFIAALSLRVGGNIVRQRVFFHKPFLFFGDGAFSSDPSSYLESISSDALWYDGTARAFLNGKGISSIHEDIWWRGRKFDDWVIGRPWVNFKRIEEFYIAHMAVPPLYPLLLALCYYLGGENTLSFFILQIILGS